MISRGASSRPGLTLLTLVLLVWGLALAARLWLASLAEHPGHGDYAFYYTVAENLVAGKGLQVDYIWHYLSHPTAIPHSAIDYWMPLTSVIISLAMLVFGQSLLVALIPSILVGVGLSVLVFFWAQEYSGSAFVAVCSAGLTLFVPVLFVNSLLTDSAIYYVLFVALGLFFAIKGTANPKLFILSGACAGLAHLTRQDGILLMVTLILVILLSASIHGKARLRYALLSTGSYLLIISPLIVANLRAFGTPFPPGPAKTMFLREYEDLYSYTKELSLGTYLAWGLPNILGSKLNTAVINLITLAGFLDHFLWIFVSAGLLGMGISQDRQRRRAMHVPLLLFLGLVFIFYTFVATFPGQKGGFTRSSMAVVPFLVVIAVDTADRNIASRDIVLLGVIVVGSVFFFQSILATRATLDFHAQLGRQLAALKDVLIEDAREQGQAEVVIMTRNPWQVYHSTRKPAIQIPNEELDVIYQVAHRYGANYMLLPAPREALAGLYQGEASDDRFEWVTDIPGSDLKLFRIKSAEPQKKPLPGELDEQE